MAPDLVREAPRSPYATLAGLPWLPRMIDKVRALEAGTLGAYTPFPSGADQAFLDALAIDPAAFRAVVASGASDAGIAAWVETRLRPGHEASIAAFRAAYCETVYPPGSPMAGFLDRAKAELAAERPGLDVTAIRTWGQLLCIEEGHPLPAPL